MKTFKIAHLFYDLLNMYGENGNVRALVKKLEEQGIKVRVDFLSLEDDIKFNNYDLIYFGSGSDENLLLAANYLKKYKDEIIKAINDKKYFIVTGNGLEVIANLNVLDFKIKQIPFQIIGEQVYESKLIKHKIIGFQNRHSIIEECHEENLFSVISGTGWSIKGKYEGTKKNNFYGTYLLGPLLIRNPYFLEYLVKDILKDKYKKSKEDISFKAYHEFIKNFVN